MKEFCQFDMKALKSALVGKTIKSIRHNENADEGFIIVVKETGDEVHVGYSELEGTTDIVKKEDVGNPDIEGDVI